MEYKYQEIFVLLNENKLIEPIYFHLLQFIEHLIKDKNNKDYILIILLIYFIFISHGNICLSLTKDIALNKLNNFISSSMILLKEDEQFDEEKFVDVCEYLKLVLSNYLYLINEDELKEIIGKDSLFVIEDNYLFIQKYNKARNNIKLSIDRLFKDNSKSNVSFIDYKTYVRKDISFSLSDGQKDAVIKGMYNNLVITGGPGTGKTTSILFLLINLLLENKDYDIHLCAPSGKASSRMKESIISGLSLIDKDFINEHQDVFNIISSLEESTIHRLLVTTDEGFIYNEKNRFPSKSIFIVDESSMIDICLFSSLLQAIDDESKIYIMGDKNQLPSVEVGAVFFELLKMEKLKNNIVTLDESKRFSKDTDIYAFADKINRGLPLGLNDEDFSSIKDFKVEEVKNNKPIFYYKDDGENYNDFKEVIKRWSNYFYSSLQEKCIDLDAMDYDRLKSIFAYSEQSKILCAENNNKRGVNKINKIIVNYIINKNNNNSTNGFYPGEIMMINKNNKSLDLYNGDSGLLVTFKDDDTLYLMVKKTSEIILNEGKHKDEIFKIKDFIFYPLRLIAKDEIDLAFAITIHKSQGSDYPQILVILPLTIGHPLLNRQIVYTAITRTKGNTYLIAKKECLEYSKDNIEIRDTLIA